MAAEAKTRVKPRILMAVVVKKLGRGGSTR